MRGDFAVFVLTHGRPGRVVTLDTIRRCGYTGRWYMVVDNEDDTVDEYRERYGEDRVIVFDKELEAKLTDSMDTSKNRGVIVYARNVCFRLASELGLTYFLELDDDYKWMEHRYIEDGRLKSVEVRDADGLFEAYCEFLRVSEAQSVAMAQGGDFIGGAESANFRRGCLRKAMNTFFCMTERPFRFVGRVNEDVNTYVGLGQTGMLFLTACGANIVQLPTQSNAGGMTGEYLSSGTYVKSFYTVMIAPSCVRVKTMGNRHRRMHHHIDWRYAVPKIVSGRYCKRLVGYGS